MYFQYKKSGETTSQLKTVRNNNSKLEGAVVSNFRSTLKWRGPESLSADKKGVKSMFLMYVHMVRVLLCVQNLKLQEGRTHSCPAHVKRKHQTQRIKGIL